MDITALAVHFYQDSLFRGTSQFQLSDFDDIPSLVLNEDDVELCRVLKIEEVRQVVFSIDPFSAPEPDGFCIDPLGNYLL